MAGSYKHCVDEQGRFTGVNLLDDLGDAYEALEEMYGMIWWLAYELAAGKFAYDGLIETEQIRVVEEARQNYQTGLSYSPGIEVKDA